MPKELYSLKEAIESGKPFKHKDHQFWHDDIPPYMKKAIAIEWEIGGDFEKESIERDKIKYLE